MNISKPPEYVDKILTGNLTRSELQKMGFPWSHKLIERSRASVGATLAALFWAKKESVSLSLAGGTHHAMSERAAGFCLFNDVAIAAIQELRSDHAARVLVVDCDVHQGDGTAEILSNYPRAYTLSIHSARNFPHKKFCSDHDIELADRTEDAEYLEKLADGLSMALSVFNPTIMFFNAGVDVFEGDRLGRLKLTAQGLRRRDSLVFDLARLCSAKIVTVMGGGYSDNPTQIANLHYQTVELALASWKAVNQIQ